MTYIKKDWTKIDILSKKYKAVQLLGGKCEECGEQNIYTLEFHHKVDTEKEYTFWEIKDNRWSIIEKEIEKCILLCGNCHNKLHIGENTNSKLKNNKKLYLEYKGVSGCEKCGYNECYASLDFHHLDKKEKDFMLSEVTISYSNIQNLTENIENEINKCSVLCKNCHKLEHADFNFFEENKEKIIKKSKNLKEIQSKIDRNVVKELYENGMKQIDISRHLNCVHSTISGIIKELNTKKPTI